MALRALRIPPATQLVDYFVTANLAFLGADIAIAHMENHFERSEEWLPIGFSAVATVLMLPQLSAKLRPKLGALAMLVAATAIAIGVGGMLYHLNSAFFELQTMKSLVYSAPFIAPLAYVGVGLLLAMNRMVPGETIEWGRWVVLLSLGGAVGNFGLSLLDHAQNGFFRPAEWISVIAAAFGVAFLAIAFARPRDRSVLRVTLVMLAVQALVGVLGFVLHTAANLEATGPTFRDRFVYGAPAFAPLLFANISLLSAIGILALWKSSRPAPSVARLPTR